MATKDTSTHDDPLMQIQQTEEKVRQKTVKKEEENRKEIEKTIEKENTQLKQSEEEARSAGNKKIEEAKSKASEDLKTKLATVEREVGSLADKAETSKKEAIDLVVKAFESELKK